MGTATMATHAVIRRMSSFCCTPASASFSAARVVCVEVRVWKNSMTPCRNSRCPSAMLLTSSNWSARSENRAGASSGTSRARLAIRVYVAPLCTAIVRTASSSYQIWNSSSRNASGASRSSLSMTRCSSRPDSRASLAIRSISRRVSAVTIAWDSSNGERGIRAPRSMRRSTVRVSSSATSGSTAGFSGPCTVTR